MSRGIDLQDYWIATPFYGRQLHNPNFSSGSPQRHDNGRLPSESEDRDYHTAPRVWGIYAFSRGFANRWRLGWGDYDNHKKNGRFRWMRDENGGKVVDTGEDEIQFYGYEYRDVKKYSKREQLLRRINKIKSNYVSVRSTYKEGEPSYYYYEKPTYFSYSGEIWHHLEFFEYSKCIDMNHFGERWIDGQVRLVKEAEVIDRCGSWIKTSMRTYRYALQRYSNLCKFYCKKYWCSPKALERYERYNIALDAEEALEVYIEKL